MLALKTLERLGYNQDVDLALEYLQDFYFGEDTINFSYMNNKDYITNFILGSIYPNKDIEPPEFNELYDRIVIELGELEELEINYLNKSI